MRCWNDRKRKSNFVICWAERLGKPQLTRIGRTLRCNRLASEHLCWRNGIRKTDDRWTSTTNLRRTSMRMCPDNNSAKITDDSIHRCSNPTKCCDGLASQCTVDISYNEMRVAVCTCDISDTYYFAQTFGSHCHPIQGLRSYHHNRCPHRPIIHVSAPPNQSYWVQHCCRRRQRSMPHNSVELVLESTRKIRN